MISVKCEFKGLALHRGEFCHHLSHLLQNRALNFTLLLVHEPSQWIGLVVNLGKIGGVTRIDEEGGTAFERAVGVDAGMQNSFPDVIIGFFLSYPLVE